VRRLLRKRLVNLVTFTSSSTVRNFLALLGDDAVAQLEGTAVGCIGPITADTARAAGLEVTIQPNAYTIPAFAQAIVAYFEKNRPRSASSFGGTTEVRASPEGEEPDG
jgi:uroporphyrinogen III methyltransferase/synthase